MPNLSFRFENCVCIPHTYPFWMDNHFADGVEFCSLLTWYNMHLYEHNLYLFLPKRILWQVVPLLIWNPFEYSFGWASVCEGSIPIRTTSAFLFFFKDRACRDCLQGIVVKIQSDTILWFVFILPSFFIVLVHLPPSSVLVDCEKSEFPVDHMSLGTAWVLLRVSVLYWGWFCLLGIICQSLVLVVLWDDGVIWVPAGTLQVHVLQYHLITTVSSSQEYEWYSEKSYKNKQMMKICF